jgi:hypothetical protein
VRLAVAVSRKILTRGMRCQMRRPSSE